MRMPALTRVLPCCLIALAACSAPHPKPGPLPDSAPTRHHGEVGQTTSCFRDRLVGTPYHYGGNTRKAASTAVAGRVRVRDVAGIVLPRRGGNSEIGVPEIGHDSLESGDLVFFRHTPQHQSRRHLRRRRPLRARAERGGTVRSIASTTPTGAHYSGAKRSPCKFITLFFAAARRASCPATALWPVR
jgi:hypothetical protein